MKAPSRQGFRRAPIAVRALSYMACVTLAGSCAVIPEPTIRKDPLIMSETWHTTTPAASTEVGPWWRQFGDEQLNALIELGVAAHPTLQAAAARVLEAQAQARIAGAEGLPMLRASLAASRDQRVLGGFPSGPSGGDPLTTRASNYGLSLAVSWEADLWGRMAHAERAAVADAEAMAVLSRATELSLAAQMSKAYMSGVALEHQKMLARADVAVASEMLDHAQDRYRRGLGTSIEVEGARTELATAQTVLSAYTRASDAITRQVETLCLNYPAGQLRFPSELPGVLEPVPAGVPSELLGRRPDLIAAELRSFAAWKRTEESRAATLPRFSLTASGGLASDELRDVVSGDFGVWSLGANLLAPLFEGGRLEANVERSDAAYARSVEEYRAVLHQALREVETFLAAEVVLREELAVAQVGEEAARQAQQLAEDRYRRGLGEMRAVHQAKRRVTGLALKSTQLKLEQVLQRVDLVVALGGPVAVPARNG